MEIGNILHLNFSSFLVLPSQKKEINYLIKKFLLLACLFLKRTIKWSPLQFRTRENFIKIEAELEVQRKGRPRRFLWGCYCPSDGGGLRPRKVQMYK